MEMFWLVFAHFLADLPLQGEWVAKEKANWVLFMFGHCMIWTGCVALALIIMGIYESWHIPFLFTGHYIMDSLKCARFKKFADQRTTVKWVYGDQLFHLGQLLCVYAF